MKTSTHTLTDLEILAALDNLRIIHPNDEYIIRLASAVVAKGMGYSSRADWTEELREAGLVSYGIVEDQAAARENYRKLMEKADGKRF